jgi:hypothetical protein
MQRIAARHPGDSRIHFIIMDYFKEAFQLPLLRNVVPGEDYSPNSRHAHYNRDVVPEMVQRIPDWHSGSLTGTWLDGAVVRSLSEHVARLGGSRCQELERIWDTLNGEEKQFIIRRIAMKDYYWDALKSLALLSERLQQQIVELESRLREERHGQADSEGRGAPGK